MKTSSPISFMKSGIQYISHINPWTLIFNKEFCNFLFLHRKIKALITPHEVWNSLSFPYGNLDVYFPTWNIEYSISKIKYGHWFSYMKYRILCIAHRKICAWILSINCEILYDSISAECVYFLHETLMSLYFTYVKLIKDFLNIILNSPFHIWKSVCQFYSIKYGILAI